MRRHAPRETLLSLLVILLLLAGGLALGWWISTLRPAYHPQSRAATGTLALKTWLERMGFQVRALPTTMAQPPADVEMILLFPGSTSVTVEDARMLHDWVAAGHTLVLVAMNDFILDAQLDLKQTDRFAERIPENSPLFQDTPLLPDGPASLRPAAPSFQSLKRDAPAALPVLSQRVGEKRFPAVVVQQVGKGAVWHVAAQAAPTNQALQEDAGYLVIAWLRTVSEGGVILMDLYHPLSPTPAHAFQPGAPGLLAYLLRTSWGVATLAAATLMFLFLLLQGRRLGPAIPPPRAIRRREAAEYVVAMAQLKQRARQRRTVARHQNRRLRAGLARHWPIDPSLPSEAFITALQEAHDPPSPALIQRIEAVLTALERAPSEAQLVRLAAEVDAILEQAAARRYG